MHGPHGICLLNWPWNWLFFSLLKKKKKKKKKTEKDVDNKDDGNQSNKMSITKQQR